MSADPIVVAGYVVRCPLGGYAWQVLHYLVGLRALGFDPYFYEDTAYYADCFDPCTGNMHVSPDAGVAFAADFFARFGFGDRWMFWDAARNQYHGRDADEMAAVLHRAPIVITLAPVTRLPHHRRGQRAVFIDIDPGYTQIRAAAGDTALCALLAMHDRHFTFGENIGTAHCAIPAGGFEWVPTRQPIAVDLWAPLPETPDADYTTIGRWDEQRRDVHFQGEVYGWRKRVEWMKFLDLPTRTGERFAPALDVDKVPGDTDVLRRHGWQITDPITVSRDPLVYRDFIRQSKGEFTVAKDLNVRLATGWFSDRGACYLAAGRPVVTQDTGFGQVLPLGQGVFAIHDLDDAVAAFTTLAADYRAHAQAARQLAAAYFDARRVLGDLIQRL